MYLPLTGSEDSGSLAEKILLRLKPFCISIVRWEMKYIIAITAIAEMIVVDMRVLIRKYKAWPF